MSWTKIKDRRGSLSTDQAGVRSRAVQAMSQADLDRMRHADRAWWDPDTERLLVDGEIPTDDIPEGAVLVIREGHLTDDALSLLSDHLTEKGSTAVVIEFPHEEDGPYYRMREDSARVLYEGLKRHFEREEREELDRAAQAAVLVASLDPPDRIITKDDADRVAEAAVLLMKDRAGVKPLGAPKGWLAAAFFRAINEHLELPAARPEDEGLGDRPVVGTCGTASQIDERILGELRRRFVGATVDEVLPGGIPRDFDCALFPSGSVGAFVKIRGSREECAFTIRFSNDTWLVVIDSSYAALYFAAG